MYTVKWILGSAKIVKNIIFGKDLSKNLIKFYQWHLHEILYADACLYNRAQWLNYTSWKYSLLVILIYTSHFKCLVSLSVNYIDLLVIKTICFYINDRNFEEAEKCRSWIFKKYKELKRDQTPWLKHMLLSLFS